MYASQWLWSLAQMLLLPNWIAGWSSLATFLPLYLSRVPNEERMMLDHFGDAYRAYAERTGRVLPRLRGQGE
jgi:protein-S-isoprenylcysteine O-methyltransferase Ste14